MSLRPQTVPPMPEETARGARAAFAKGNLYLQLRDEIGVLFEDADLAGLIPNSRTACICPVATRSDYHFPIY